MDVQVYCLCHKPYDEANPQFMIECNNCGEWMHGECVFISEADAANIDTYSCPQCCPPRGATTCLSRARAPKNHQKKRKKKKRRKKTWTEQELVFFFVFLLLLLLLLFHSQASGPETSARQLF